MRRRRCVCVGGGYAQIFPRSVRRGTASNDSRAALNTHGTRALDFKHLPPETTTTTETWAPWGNG